MTEVNWEMVSALGQVAGAAATFAAVVVSLRIASRSEQPILRISAQLSVTLGPHAPMDFVGVSIANLGVRPETITSLGWSHRSKRRERLIFNPSTIASNHKLPVSVEPGQKVEFGWSVADYRNSAEHMQEWATEPWLRFRRHIYVWAGTATGATVRARVTPSVQRLFESANPALFIKGGKSGDGHTVRLADAIRTVT